MPNGRRFDFTNPVNPLPKRIILDANIIFNQVKPQPTTYQKAINLYNDSRVFFRRLTNANNSTGYVTQTVINECFHLITISTLEDYATTNNLIMPARKIDLLKRQPQLMQICQIPQILGNFLQLLKSSRIIIIQPSRIPNLVARSYEADVLDIMDKLNSDSSDATIVVEARRLGISQIASVDKDMSRITRLGMDFYTSPNL